MSIVDFYRTHKMSSDYLERGLFEFSHGNFKTAEKCFTTVIDQDEEFENVIESLKRRATCRHEQGNYDDAICDANRVIKMAPKCTSGYALCGNALAKKKKYEEALDVYKLGVEIDSNDEEIKNGLKGLQQQVIEDFEKNHKDTTYDAVKMSSQEPYPGDNELETYEKDIMEAWGLNEFPPLEMAMPDTQKARQEFQSALQLRKAGNDKMALEKLRVRLIYYITMFDVELKLDKKKCCRQYCFFPFKFYFYSFVYTLILINF